MDLKALSKSLGVEEKEYKTLIELFIETSMSDLEKLQSSIETANAEEAATIVHSLKGAALNLDLMEICEIAKKMEITVNDGQLEDIVQICSVLENKLNAINGSIR